MFACFAVLLICAILHHFQYTSHSHHQHCNGFQHKYQYNSYKYLKIKPSLFDNKNLISHYHFDIKFEYLFYSFKLASFNMIVKAKDLFLTTEFHILCLDYVICIYIALQCISVFTCGASLYMILCVCVHVCLLYLPYLSPVLGLDLASSLYNAPGQKPSVFVQYNFFSS